MPREKVKERKVGGVLQCVLRERENMPQGWFILGGRFFSTTKGAGFSSPSTLLRSGCHNGSFERYVRRQCVENINKYNG